MYNTGTSSHGMPIYSTYVAQYVYNFEDVTQYVYKFEYIIMYNTGTSSHGMPIYSTSSIFGRIQARKSSARAIYFWGSGSQIFS